MRIRRPQGETISFPCGERHPTNGQKRSAQPAEPLTRLGVTSLSGVGTSSRRHGFRLQRPLPAVISGSSREERRESSEEEEEEEEKKKLTGSGKRRMRRELIRNDTETGEGPAVQLRPAPVVVHEFKPSEPPAAVRAVSEQRRVTFEAAHPSKAGPKSKGKGRKGGKSNRPRPGPRKGKGSGKKKEPGGPRWVLPPHLR